MIPPLRSLPGVARLFRSLLNEYRYEILFILLLLFLVRFGQTPTLYTN